MATPSSRVAELQAALAERDRVIAELLTRDRSELERRLAQELA